MDVPIASSRMLSHSSSSSSASQHAEPSTPAPGLISPHRSPKGPRPAPSSFHNAHGTLEPTRVPLPVDLDVEEILFPSLAMANSNDHLNDSYYEPRNEPDAISTSLFSATSASSPPPFARSSLIASSSHTEREYDRDRDPIATSSTVSPDPWVSQTAFTLRHSIATQSNPITQRPIASTKPLRNAFPITDGSDLTPKIDGDQLDPVSAQNLSNSTKAGIESSNEEAQAVHVLSTALENSTLGTDDALKPSNNASVSIPIPAPASVSAVHRLAPIAPLRLSSPNSKSLMPGSYGTSSIFLAESTTWEKIDPLNDEWTELSNPKEDIVVISESEDSEDDDEEWEESRKVKGVAESGFLPTLERKRREAARATQNGSLTTTGATTPRGKRTPTTSFAQNGGRVAAVESYSHTHNQGNNNTTAGQSKLNPRQEQVVSELQRARNKKAMGGVSPIPVPYAHAQMNSRHVVPLSSDW